MSCDELLDMDIRMIDIPKHDVDYELNIKNIPAFDDINGLHGVVPL